MDNKLPWYKRLGSKLFNITKEFFSHTSTTSFMSVFVGSYYAYLGIAVSIMTGTPAVFVVWALPAIALLVMTLMEAAYA